MYRSKSNTSSRARYGLGLCACLLGLALSSSAGHCDEPVSVKKLSLAEAVAMALDINPNLKQAEENQAASKSRLKIANIYTTFDIATTANLAHTPYDSSRSGNLLGELTYANLRGTQLSLGLAPLGTGSDRGSVGITLRHPLMKGKGLFSDKTYELEGAKLNTTIQEKQLYLTRQATIQSVISAYYRAVEAREQVKVQEQALEISQTAADGAREKAKERQTTEIEVSRAEIRVAQTKDQLNIQTQAAQGAIDRLMIAIGQGVGSSPEMVDTVPPVDFEVPTLSQAIDKALANRLELTVYDLQIADQERALALRQDRLRPKLDVVAGFNSLSPNDGIISSSIYDLGSFSAGIEYRLPMDRRALEEDRDIAARGLDVTHKLRVFQMEQVAESVRSAYRALEESKTSVEILSQNVKVAQDNLALAQEMVDEGLDDNRNVLDGQEALTKAENGLLSAKVDLFLAAVNLKYAMGEDLVTIGQ